MTDASTTEFYAYTPEGKVVMSGCCPITDLEKQLYPGASIAVGGAKFRAHYIDGDGSIKEMGVQPGPGYVFDYTVKKWVLDPATAWGVVRYQRDQKLAATDWTTLADVPLAPEVRAAWMAYRQALRDVTDQVDPDAVVWPVAPD